jgi:hypothetical protein
MSEISADVELICPNGIGKGIMLERLSNDKES